MRKYILISLFIPVAIFAQWTPTSGGTNMNSMCAPPFSRASSQISTPYNLDLNGGNINLNHDRAIVFGRGQSGIGEYIINSISQNPSFYGMSFFAGCQERMRIQNDGNVGIGNLYPTGKLDVISPPNLLNAPRFAMSSNGTSLTSTNTNMSFFNRDLTDGNWSRINFVTNLSSGAEMDMVGLAVNYRSRTPGLESGDFIIATQHNGTYSEKIRLLGNGNLGIGTSSPTAQIHTTGTVRFQGITGPQNLLTRILALDSNGNVFWRDASTLGGSSVSSGQGITVSGGTVNLGDVCGSFGGLFSSNRQISLNDKNLYFSANAVQSSKADGNIYMGTNTCKPLRARLEISSAGQTNNPVNDYVTANPSTSGLRFTDLTSLSPQIRNKTGGVLSLDADGDVIWVKDSFGGAGSSVSCTDVVKCAWGLYGNTTTTLTEYIGTKNDDDFRIRTRDTQRAQYTRDGNYDFGNPLLPNSFTPVSGRTPIICGAYGLGNDLRGHMKVSYAFGQQNTIDNSDAILVAGVSNYINSTSTASFVAGISNRLTNSSSSATVGSSNNLVNVDYAFASGATNSISGVNAAYSATLGNTNIINNSRSSFAAGEGNNIQGSSSSQASIALGDMDTIINSQASLAAGKQNLIDESDYSGAIGHMNKIKRSSKAFTAGFDNLIDGADGPGSIAMGAAHIMKSSNASFICGEANEMHNGHGSFIAGGHNYSDGVYNMLLGQWLRTDATSPILIPPRDKNIMIMGERINSDLNQSLTVGFQNNRTTVVTKRGMSIQLNPNTVLFPNTYSPTVNFEVDAGIAGDSALPPCPLRSNIRFHNLPDAPDELPVVMIDPSTGELFKSKRPYQPIIINNPNPNEMIQSLEKSVKEQQVQIANQQKQIDELMAALSTMVKGNESINEINLGLSNKDIYLLDQNIPNPCDVNTTIRYNLPSSVKKAVLTFTTLEGKLIKSISIAERGKGVLNVYTSDLSAGVYMYSLTADDKLIDTKKMEVNR